MTSDTFTLETPERTKARRRVGQALFRGATLLALALVLIPAIWIVVGIIARALPHLSFSVLTQTSAHGGLSNALWGSIIIMVGVAIIAGTFGLGAGVYLAEMSGASRRAKTFDSFLRTATEVLSGVPSIVLGFVGYVALVVGLHWGYSLLPALIILSLMVVPYIAKATESSLSQVPTSYREGADALGMSTGYSLRHIILRAALPGITTGLLVALAIAGGETAPLLYTAGWSDQMPSLALTGHQVPYLTYPVWAYYNQPNKALQNLSYDAALILLVLVVGLLVASRIIVARTQRHADVRR
jgi:phosphate transport system permease protein